MSAILQGIAGMQNNPLRLKMRLGTGVPAYFHNGIPYEADGAVAAFTGAPTHFHQGLPFNIEGRLCRIGAAEPSYFGSGAAPFASSRLNDIPSASPTHYSSGVGYNPGTPTGGRVAYQTV